MKSGRPWYSSDDLDCYPEDVQALGVRHVIGFSKDFSSTPLAFVSDGLVAYIAGCFVTLFDLRTNCQVQHLCLESRKRAFSCLTISDDTKLLATGEQGEDARVLVWMLNQGPVQRPIELKGHTNTITAIAFSPNGDYLATVGNTIDSQLIVWDCQTETALCSQLIHLQANLTSLSFSTDSKALYTSGKAHFTMWGLTQKNGGGGASVSPISLTSKPAMPSTEKGVDIVDVKAGFSGKSSFLFAVTRNGVLYKLRQHKGGMNIEKKIDLRASNVSSLAVGVNKIAVSCANSIVKIVRSKTMSVEATITKPPTSPESSSSSTAAPDALYCAFDQPSSSLATVYSDNSVAFWDSEDVSEVRCYHMIRSCGHSITDIFALHSPSDRKSIDRNAVKAMRSPNIHNPQAVESEFATCSDDGMISLWNLKMQTAHPRTHVLISPASNRRDVSFNPRVEVEVKTIAVNPPATPKARPGARRTKAVIGGAKSTKDPKKNAKATTAVKPRRIAARQVPVGTSTASASKKTTLKKKDAGMKPAQRGKRVVGTPGPMRLSTELTGSTVLRAPVVAVHKPGPSKGSTVDVDASKTAAAEEAHLTCLRSSHNGLHLVVGDNKGQLRIYHLPSMKLLSKKALHSSPITTIEFSLPGEQGEILLASGAKDGSVSVIEVHNEFKIKLEKEDHDQPVTGLAFAPGTPLITPLNYDVTGVACLEGKAVVSCGQDNYLYYESLNQTENIDVDEEDIDLFLSRHFLMTSTFEAMHFNDARNTYMLACSDNFIRVFNTAGQFVHSIQIPAELGAPRKILQGPVPTMIITCHENNKIGIFEYFTGKLLATGEVHSKLMGALLINNGRHLVTAGEDGVMIIWELQEDLCRRCMALPAEMSVQRTEAGYANELFYRIQKEKERAYKAGSVYSCSEEKNSGHPLLERMASFEHSSFSGASTPIASRAGSRMSGIGLPMMSPVTRSSQPTMVPCHQPNLPSWMCKADAMSEDLLLDGYESTSPSIYTAGIKRLDLGGISDTDDESVQMPVQRTRGHTLLDGHNFTDLESIPVDHFAMNGGFSRNGLGLDQNRFNYPVDSMPRGRPSRESSCGGSPMYNFNPCSSLAQYQDGPSEALYGARFASPDEGFERPTVPEPPSSVSCASDSRTSTPFSLHPGSCFNPDQMLANMREVESQDEAFSMLRGPHTNTGPIGPNIHRIASRTPQSMYSDDKTVVTRPNSEEQTMKMFSECRPVSAESMTHIQSPFQVEQKNVYWNQQFGDIIEAPVSLGDSDDEASIHFDCPPAEQLDTPVARAGGRMNKNPLYSSGSEASDLAHCNMRHMARSIGSFTDFGSLEKEVSFDDMAEIDDYDSRESIKAGSVIRQSMDLVFKAIKASVAESLDKLRDEIGLHQSLEDCQMPTSRKQACVSKTQKELAAFLENLGRHN